jgi:hypothetical protein
VANETARVRRLAAALLVAVGCTTKVINLAVDDGGTDKVSMAGADADAAPSTDFDQAYDAGPVVGGSRYLQFTCCVLGDAIQCSDERLGGPDACYDWPTWKSRATERCAALGLNLGDANLYGSCVFDGGL